MNAFKRLSGTKVFSALIALVVILLFNLILNPNFFGITVIEGHLYGSLIDILNRSVPIMLLALGMTFVIATGGTDLSVGAVVAVSGAVAVSLIRGGTEVVNEFSAMPLILVILISVAIATIFGLGNGTMVAIFGVQPIVATLILMVAGRGIAQLITNARNLTTNFKEFATLGQGWFLGLPVSVFIVAAVALILFLLSKRTALGLFVESVGINRSASTYLGINSKRIILGVYAISGFCAGVSGLIVSSNIMCADANNAGLNFELDAILAVVIGGTSMAGGKFSLMGSIIGALIIQSLTTSIYSFNVPPEVTLVVKALVVVGVVLLQSEPVRRAMEARKAYGGAK